MPTNAGAKLSAELLKDWFCSFYEGFQKDARVWFLYEDSAELEHPLDFRFEDINHETIESSPPRQSNSGKDIQYAPGLIPNGDGLTPPVIGYDAPKTSALLQGLIREPADAGKKRKTRSSAVNIAAPSKKKKTKKTKPADDLPTLDPSIEQVLDEEIIEDEIDQAAAEQSSSDQTPSAVGSHHVEQKEPPAAPAIPVLADLFSFDIGDYLDEGEEDTTSKALAPLSDDVKKTLGSILDQLEASSLDSLVVDCGSIRAWLHEIQALIPDELADILTLAVYLEQHQFKLEKAKLRLAELRERKDIEATIQANRQLVHEEKSKLDQLSKGPIKSNIDRLKARKIDLLAQLEECNAELDMEHKKLADLPKSIEEQKSRLKSAIKHVADLTKSLKVIPRTDAQDSQAIEEVEQIRQKAISAIQRYLSQ
uniref:Aminotransferase-like n=1 Tax=Oryza sativa subsp. japonica TaxID=39947 RepID=Q69IV6_ORYSJ|nr:aminotransferase-like [Oryza sativa Japonica Group]